MKENQRDKLLKRLKNKASAGGRSAAIDWFCATCIFDSESIGAGSWRSQTTHCQAITCPLYKFRRSEEHTSELQSH